MASTSPNVKLVPLGKDGPLVPQLGFGLMGMSYAVYGAALSDEERFKILDRAWEIGARFWDSAEFVILLFLLFLSHTFFLYQLIMLLIFAVNHFTNSAYHFQTPS